jgi:hypothetical protein
MTIKTQIICDCCQKEIKSMKDLAFTISSIICEIKLEMHFCRIDCMREYLEKK